MRLIEIFMAVGLFGLLIERLRTSNKDTSIRLLSIGTIISLLLHVTLEGVRWQMSPIYVLLTLFLAGNIWNQFRASPVNARNRRKMPRIFVLLSGLLLLSMGVALGVLLPMPDLPTSSGNYAVGTTSFAFTDESRPEIFTPTPADRRLVYVQVWYPTDSTVNSSRTSMWITPERVTPLLAESLDLPGFLFSHFTLAKSNSYLNAPLSTQADSYPILVFSHGYDLGFFAQNTVQMEELASQGYVVFSIGHAYESVLVMDTHGQVIPANKDQISSFYEEATKNVSLQEQAVSASGADRIRTLHTLLDASPIAERSMQVWTQDTQFVLTQIEQMNLGRIASPFNGRLDTSRIGIFGMSFGGATAVQVCAIDSRCKAALNMDGFQHGTVLDDRLKVPFLMMYNETSAGMNDYVLENMVGGGASLVVKDTVHFNYTDFNLVSPLFRSVGVLGRIDPLRMEDIMNTYILAFFDQTLRDQPSLLLQGASPDYPEVELHVYSALPK